LKREEKKKSKDKDKSRHKDKHKSKDKDKDKKHKKDKKDKSKDKEKSKPVLSSNRFDPYGGDQSKSSGSAYWDRDRDLYSHSYDQEKYAYNGGSLRQ